MKKLAKYILIFTVCAFGLCGCAGKAETADKTDAEAASAGSDASEAETDAVPENSEEDSGEEGIGGRVDFSGSYTEPDTGRCLIEISKDSEESYTITVNWASGASEERIWAITGATYGDEGDQLVYSDALCYDRITDDEGNYTDEDIYSDGSGIFSMTEGGMLRWESDQVELDGVNGDIMFERMELSEMSDEMTPDADEGAEAGEDSSMTDLFEYYGANIDNVATDIPELKYDDSYKSAEGTTEISPPAESMEKMSDGYALAGPFFTVDKSGTVVGVNYGGRKYYVCGITAGIPMSEAAQIAKSHGFTFSNVDIAHGTAKYVVEYDNGEMRLFITSDADGDFGKTEESDVTGNVDGILLTTVK